MLYATFIGTMFGALLLRTHKLWLLVILHAFIDFVNNFDLIVKDMHTINVPRSNVSPEDALVMILVVLPYFIYGLILLRKVKLEDVRVKIEG